jgi:hypothetical protein
MKANYLSLLFVLLLLSIPAKSDTKQDDINEDFLEFLAEMEEATGDGFEQWIDDESIDIRTKNEKHDEKD